MSLDVLERLDPKERAGLLTSLALATSPSPEKVELTKRQTELLAAIYRHVGFSERQDSEPAKTRVDEFITEALAQAVVSDSDIAGVMSRAGSDGQLPPSLYQIVIPEGFMKSFSQFHVRQQDVDSNVRQADDVQHLRNGNDSSISLFVRSIEGKSGRDPYWTIAQFHRDGAILSAHNFWRVYLSDIDIAGVSEPIHLLESFVKVMGSPITADGHTSNFIRDQPIKNQDASSIDFVVTGIDAIGTLSNGTDPETGQKEIILAYGVDTGRYRAYLARHGVPVSNAREQMQVRNRS